MANEKNQAEIAKSKQTADTDTKVANRAAGGTTDAKKAFDPKATEDYELLRDVSIGGKIVKKGESVSLTQDGRKYFKSKSYIK